MTAIATDARRAETVQHGSAGTARARAARHRPNTVIEWADRCERGKLIVVLT
jgi:hypothetical protein